MLLSEEEYKFYLVLDWWRHCGYYDREQASGIPFSWDDNKDGAEYLFITDEWWDSLTNEQKEEVYDDFFDDSY